MRRSLLSLTLIALLAGAAPRAGAQGSPDVAPDAAIAVVRDLDPTLADELARLRERDPEAFAARLQAIPRLRSLVALRERDEHAYALELLEVRTDAEVERGSRAVREAAMRGDAAALARARQALRPAMLLQEAFRHRAREEFLCRLKEQVDATRAEMESIRTQVDEIAEARVRAAISGEAPAIESVGRVDDAEDVGDDVEPAAPRAVVLDAGMVERCLEVADDVDPELGRRLRELRDRDPEIFVRRLQGSRSLIKLAELKSREPSLYDLKRRELQNERDVAELTARLREAAAAGASIEGLAGTLRMQVILQQAFRYHARQSWLGRLEDRVSRLERSLDEEKATIDARVDRRLDALSVPE